MHKLTSQLRELSINEFHSWAIPVFEIILIQIVLAKFLANISTFTDWLIKVDHFSKLKHNFSIITDFCTSHAILKGLFFLAELGKFSSYIEYNQCPLNMLQKIRHYSQRFYSKSHQQSGIFSHGHMPLWCSKFLLTPFIVLVFQSKQGGKTYLSHRRPFLASCWSPMLPADKHRN